MITRGYGFYKSNVDVHKFEDHAMDCFGLYNITYLSIGGNTSTTEEYQQFICVGINSKITAATISGLEGYIKVDGISYNLTYFPESGVNYNGQLWFAMGGTSETNGDLNIKNIAGKEIELMLRVNQVELSDHYILNSNSRDELRKILVLHNNDLSGITLEFTDNVTDLNEYFSDGFLDTVNLVNAPKCIIGKNITSVKRMFENTKITRIDDSLLDGLPNITDASNLFYSCRNITNIPGGLFKNCRKITNMSGSFGNCVRLTSIPEGLFSGLTEVTSFNKCFLDCRVIEFIPENIFDDCINAVDFSSCFSGMTSIKSVRNIFKNNINAKNFASIFHMSSSDGHTPQLSDISKLTFSNTKAINFNYAFSGTPITNVHKNLFQGKGKDFSNVFYRCENLISVDDHTFDLCDISSSESAFYCCSKLERVKNNLFKSSSSEKVDISGMFKECQNLADISGTRFQISAQCNVNSIFSECSNLTTIPDNLIEDTPNIIDIDYAFSDCSSLSSVPENLFDTQTYRRLRFTGVFLRAGITTIPEKLFKSNLDYYYCAFMFSSCDKLTTIPFNLFDNVSETIDCVDWMFDNCANITSKVPELWKMTSYGQGCYSGCAKAENYADIPSDWK